MAIVPFVIGIAVAAVGVIIGILLYRKNQSRYQEMKYQQTSSIEDVISIVDRMVPVDMDYHHYCEIKGIVQSDAPIVAPYSNTPAAYYKNRCLSVTQVVQTIRDEKGGTRTFTTKQEQEISRDQSSADIYIVDQQTGQRIYVDKESFGSVMELMQACDRFEASGSSWAQNNSARFQINLNFNRANFLGYRLIEQVLPQGQPVYVLGEVYKRGDRYYIGKSVRENKPTVFSYKSEDEMTNKAKSTKTISIVILIAGIVIGAGLVAFSFTNAAKQMMGELSDAGSSYSTSSRQSSQNRYKTYTDGYYGYNGYYNGYNNGYGYNGYTNGGFYY